MNLNKHMIANNHTPTHKGLYCPNGEWKFCQTFPEPDWGLTQLSISLFATDKTFSRFWLFIGSTSYEVAHINTMWNLFRGYQLKIFFLCYCFQLSLKMWAPKYQCGQVKLGKLGAHMAPGVLKLFATLEQVGKC